MGQLVKARWADPDYRERCRQSMSIAQKKAWQNPNHAVGHATAEQKKARSEATKARWADPVFRERELARRKSQRLPESSKAGWANPEYRERELARRKAAKAATA